MKSEIHIQSFQKKRKVVQNMLTITMNVSIDLLYCSICCMFESFISVIKIITMQYWQKMHNCMQDCVYKNHSDKYVQGIVDELVWLVVHFLSWFFKNNL